MFHFLTTCLFFFLVFTSQTIAGFLKPQYSAIVMRADTGEILHSASAEDLRHPASLTKMMTLFLVFDHLKKGKITLNTPLKISSHAVSQIPSKLGLKRGETLSVADAILALVTRSANDVAAAIAEKIAGSESAFATLMTLKARQLGMKKTTFKNASGVPHPGNITTAKDMALLSKALLEQFPQYYRYFNTKSFYFRGQHIRNHNHLLGVGGVDGIKTGLTNASGYNLAASAKKNNVRLITIVMGGISRQWRDQRVNHLMQTHFNTLGQKDNSATTTNTTPRPPYWAKGAVEYNHNHTYETQELDDLLQTENKEEQQELKEVIEEEMDVGPVSFKAQAREIKWDSESGLPEGWVRPTQIETQKRDSSKPLKRSKIKK